MGSAPPLLLENFSYLKTKVSCLFQFIQITEGTYNLHEIRYIEGGQKVSPTDGSTFNFKEQKILLNAIQIFNSIQLFIISKCTKIQLRNFFLSTSNLLGNINGMAPPIRVQMVDI